MILDNCEIDIASQDRFEIARERALCAERSGIGTMGEKGVHRTLKYYFEPHEDCHEVSIGSYIADAAGEDGIFEIQTMGFSRMKEKLNAFLRAAQVTIVYPVISSKRIIKIDKETGEIISSRKSPKKKTQWAIFRELYSIKDMLSDPDLRFCIVMLEADEYRTDDQRRGRKRRKGGASDTERIPTALLGEVWLRSDDDYRVYIPDNLPKVFTAAQFAQAAGIDIDTGRCALHVLCEKKLCRRAGKDGRTHLFSVEESV